MMGIAYLAKLDKRFPHKVNLSGPDMVIKDFLGDPVILKDNKPSYPNGWAAKNGLFEAYGNPYRKFAGAYDKI